MQPDYVERHYARLRGHQRQVLFDYVGSGQPDPSVFKPERYASLQGFVLDLRSGVTLICHLVSYSIGLLASIARPKLFDC